MSPVTIYTTRFCPYCHSAKDLLNRKSIDFDKIDVTGNRAGRAVMSKRANGRSSVPQIFVGERHVGGCDELYDLEAAGELDTILAV